MENQPDTNTSIAKLLAGAMIERRDAKAMQHANGSYSPVLAHKDGPRMPWEMKDLVSHLDGSVTYGHYVVSAENTCRMFCFDIDLLKIGEWLNTETEQWEQCEPRDVWLAGESAAKSDLRAQLMCLAAGLASRIGTILQVPAMIAYSGSKGLHVYGLLDRGTPAADAREAAGLVLDSLGCFLPSRGKNFLKHEDDYRGLEIEVYPKQDSVRDGDGLGNLLRLPLGVNRKTGQHGFFVKLPGLGQATNAPFMPDDPILALTEGTCRTVEVAK